MATVLKRLWSKSQRSSTHQTEWDWPHSMAGLTAAAIGLMSLAWIGPGLYEGVKSTNTVLGTGPQAMSATSTVSTSVSTWNAPRANFVDDLPIDAATAKTASVIEAAAAKNMVDVIRLTMEGRAADQGQLNHQEVSISLVGTYPGIKQWISATVSELPGATLQRLQLRRTPSAEAIEASVVLKLWRQPGKREDSGSLGPSR